MYKHWWLIAPAHLCLTHPKPICFIFMYYQIEMEHFFLVNCSRPTCHQKPRCHVTRQSSLLIECIITFRTCSHCWNQRRQLQTVFNRAHFSSSAALICPKQLFFYHTREPLISTLHTITLHRFQLYINSDTRVPSHGFGDSVYIVTRRPITVPVCLWWFLLMKKDKFSYQHRANSPWYQLFTSYFEGQLTVQSPYRNVW